jgi:hypothetical protein
MWRVTEPEPEFLRSRTRRLTPRPLPNPSVGERPFHRWWHV